MNATELRQHVTNYENTRLIYMNFSVDERGIWGLAEGEKTQYLLTDEKVNDYKTFLQAAIQNYTNLIRFFSNDLQIEKKLKKYKLYTKRLESAISKI